MAGRKAMPIEERFMEKVEKAASGCWEWRAGRMANGYGQFSFEGRSRLAHRAAYKIFVGPLDDEKDVMHSCDNPGCVNPAHLSLGTRAENMQDCKAKGRNTPGEKHGRAKLTETQAQAIKAASGTQKEIGAQFGVSQTAVWEIKTGRKWPHLSK